MKRLYTAILMALAVSGLGQQLAIANDSKSMKKDSKVETSHEFKLPAAAVWDLIAGFNTLPDYHASVPKSRLSKGGPFAISRSPKTRVAGLLLSGW